MKKIILFVALATLGIAFNACSSDDSKSTTNDVGGIITVKIDGVSTTFEDINVIETDTTENTVELRIIATNANDANEKIMFSTWVGAIGSNQTYHFNYINDDLHLSQSDFSTNITTHSNGKLIGTFSGTMQSVNFTDGTFNIQY